MLVIISLCFRKVTQQILWTIFKHSAKQNVHVPTGQKCSSLIGLVQFKGVARAPTIHVKACGYVNDLGLHGTGRIFQEEKFGTKICSHGTVQYLICCAPRNWRNRLNFNICQWF